MFFSYWIFYDTAFLASFGSGSVGLCAINRIFLGMALVFYFFGHCRISQGTYHGLMRTIWLISELD